MNGYLDKFKQRTNERKQPLRDAILKSKTMLSSAISLSDAVKKYSQCVDEDKIRLVQKQINVLDKVPPSIANRIDTLYLSNNSLTSMQGITQFPNLLHLSLSNNSIKDISSLQELRKVPNLESLNLQGNPVAKHPIYRSLVLTALPNLTLHDGRSVSKEERCAAEIQVKKQNALFDLMLVNYIEIQKLNYISKKLDLHQELSRGSSKLLPLHLSNPATAFQQRSRLNLPLMKRVIDLQSAFPDHVKSTMIDNLMSDVLTLYYQAIEQETAKAIAAAAAATAYNSGTTSAVATILTPSHSEACYEKAFANLLMKQQHLIASLNHDATEKANSMRELQQRLNDNYKEQSKNQHHMLSEAMQIRGRSSDDEITYNQDDLYRLKEKGSSRGRHFSPSSPLSPTSMSSSSSQQVQDRRGRTKKSPSHIPVKSLVFRKKSPVGASIKNTMSPESESVGSQELCCRRLMNSSENEIAGFKNSLQMKSPYRRTNYQLHKEVGDLSETISTQNIRIRELSSSLDEQRSQQPPPPPPQAEILVYPKSPDQQMHLQNKQFISNNDTQLNETNEENRELPHDEGAEDVPVAHEIVPPWITEQLSQLRGEINGLMEQNLKLQEQSMLKEQEERETSSKQEEAIAYLSQELQRREQLEGAADDYCQLRRKRLVFYSFLQAVQRERMIVNFRDRPRQVSVSSFFSAWNRKTLLKKYTRAENKSQTQDIMQKYLRTWFRNVKFTASQRAFREQNTQKTLFRTFLELKSLTRKRQLAANKVKLADKFHAKKLVVKAVIALKEVMQSQRIPLYELRCLESTAEAYNLHRMRAKYFDAWNAYYTEYAVPLKNQADEIILVRQKKTMTNVFACLKANRTLAREMKRRANNYVNFQEKRRRHLLFKKWKAISAATKVKKNALEKYIKTTQLQSVFHTWILAKKGAVAQRKNVLLAVNHVRRSLQLKYFMVFKKKRVRAIAERHNTKALAQILVQRNVRNTFKRWFSLAQPAQIATKQLRILAEKTLKNTFHGWQKRVAWRKKKGENAIALGEYEQKNTVKKMRDAFRLLKVYFLNGRKKRTLLDNYRRSRMFKIYREFILKLQGLQVVDLKGQLSGKKSELNAAEEAAFESEREAQEALKERNEMVDEYQRMKEEVFQQKLLIEQLQHAQVKHNSAMRSIERQERIFEEERNGFAAKYAEMEAVMQRMQEEHDTVVRKKDGEILSLITDNRLAQKEIHSLQNEVQFRQQTIVETERALLHRGDQSNVQMKETEKKLQNSVEMAAVFRTRIEEQQMEINELKDNLEGAQIDVEELKDKLRESLDLLKETAEMYDEKISDFTTIIEAKSDQVISLQHANEAKDTKIAQLNALHNRPQSVTAVLGGGSGGSGGGVSSSSFSSNNIQNQLPYFEQDMQHQCLYDFKEEQQNMERELVEQRKNLDVRMSKLNSNLLKIQHDEKRRLLFATSPETVSTHSHSHIRTSSNPKVLFADSPVSQVSLLSPTSNSDIKWAQLQNYQTYQQSQVSQMQATQQIPSDRFIRIGQQAQQQQQNEREMPIREGNFVLRNSTSQISSASNTPNTLMDELERDRNFRQAFKAQISRRITQLNSDIDRELAQQQQFATQENVRQSRSQSPEEMFNLSFRSGGN